MNTRPHPRRPAMLDPKEAELIEGDEDPALRSEIAHTVASALVGGDKTDDQVQRLVQVIEEEGVDTVSVLWARSPATTLPGLLWRLYLLREWARRDGDVVHQRYRAGLDAPEIPGLPNDTVVDLDTIMQNIDDLFRARYVGALSDLLYQTSLLLRILAAGAAFGPGWITQDSHDLADEVTRRSRALIATADEFVAGADLSIRGRLD